MAQKKLTPTFLLVVLSFVLLSIFGVLWWRNVYSNPQRVFQAMLENSLRLQSVTKVVEEPGEDQQSLQIMRLQFGSEDIISGSTRLVQKTEGGDTVVETENVGTPTADYVRYVNIETPQTNADGQAPDFSQVLGVWGKNSFAGETTITGGELYSETILGVVPFGVFNKTDREDLLATVVAENLYEVDYTSVAKNIVDDRPTYSYPVTIDAVAYVKVLKAFGEKHGLNHLTALDPADYSGQERLPFTLTVDVWSRQLRNIQYGPSGSVGGRVEHYTGHNGHYDVEEPTDAISIEELQLRLSQIQQ